MEIILKVPTECPLDVQAIADLKSKEAEPNQPPSLRTLLQLPTAGSHPVLIARKMLVLALVLQTMPIEIAIHLDEKLSRGCEDIMSRLVKTARELVTRDDDLVSSVEGLGCLNLESLYENHAGNLRRAWLISRRSVMIAQMIGLNQGVAPPSASGDTVESDDLWFRIVDFDRYLCLMLGLPQSSPNESFAKADALMSYPPNTRLQRLSSMASGLLLNRNAGELYNAELTDKIDEILRDASTSMPAQWWVTPGLASDDGPTNAALDSLRSNNHLRQYHLLLQLHLPYLLRPGTGDDWEYHRMTAVTASREVLTRFLTVHMSSKKRHYCRGIDLIAFMSCTALSISHLMPEKRHETTQGRRNYFLAQQRLSDRGLMEKVMTVAEQGVRKGDDDIFKRLVKLLQSLFAFEDNVAAGLRYNAFFVPELAKEQNLGHRVHVSEDGSMAHIHIPHFPVIKIEPQDSQELQVRGPSQTDSMEFSAGGPPPVSIDWTNGVIGKDLQIVPPNEPMPWVMDDPSASLFPMQNEFLATEGQWVTDSLGLDEGGFRQVIL